MIKKAKKVKFSHFTLEGSSYEIGKKQAELLSKQSPDDVDFFLGNADGGKLEAGKFKTYKKLFDRYCPGINEEIQGFADFFRVSPYEIVYYLFSYHRKHSCSHGVFLPKLTKRGQVFVARNYDYEIEDELRLCTTMVHGNYAHIGFSLLQFGRYDGMNDQGLSISMSGAIIDSEPEEEGVKFWVLFRNILDTCKDVNEAVDRIQSIPINDNMNFLIADKSGNAALIEIACNERAVKMIDNQSDKSFLCSTNHYTLKSMLKNNKYLTNHSINRYKILNDLGSNAVGSLTVGALKRILTKPMPYGLYCPYYTDGMGTLWSVVFNLSKRTIDVCFGSSKNKWRTFSLNRKYRDRSYTAYFWDTKAPENFWEKKLDGVLLPKNSTTE